MEIIMDTRILQGDKISDGIAMGPVYAYCTTEHQVERIEIEDTEAECERFRIAREAADHQLRGLYEAASLQVGTDYAMIFEMHQMILRDVGLGDSIERRIIEEKVCAEYAVSVECTRQEKMFLSSEDAYLRARGADVRDVAERLIGILSGEGRRAPRLKEPSIMIAQELKPSQTIQLDRGKVLGFVTQSGSENSHMAILARTMDIPAMVCPELSSGEIEQLKGKKAILDGRKGQLIVEPKESLWEQMREEKKEEERRLTGLQSMKGLPDETSTGKKLGIYANIGGIRDLEAVLENDAAGIGLLRSEFLFIESREAPSEERQFQIYRTILRTMRNKPVILRTLDLGADKQVDYMRFPEEENPALGCRAIRLCLANPELFKTQLRAILRAGMYGNAHVMYPMITSIQELDRIEKLVREAGEELTARGIAWRKLPTGVMIETPAAALISDKLASRVDFFSIGTNDLGQYTMAMDRQNASLAPFFDPHHPALLKLIALTVENAHKAGITVGICGELGADEKMLPQWVELGVDEISVSPAKILSLRKRLREL